MCGAKKKAEGKVSLTHDTHMMRTKFAAKRCSNNMGKPKVCFVFFLTLERHNRNRNCKRKEIYVRLI